MATKKELNGLKEVIEILSDVLKSNTETPKETASKENAIDLNNILLNIVKKDMGNIGSDDIMENILKMLEEVQDDGIIDVLKELINIKREELISILPNLDEVKPKENSSNKLLEELLQKATGVVGDVGVAGCSSCKHKEDDSLIIPDKYSKVMKIRIEKINGVLEYSGVVKCKGGKRKVTKEELTLITSILRKYDLQYKLKDYTTVVNYSVVIGTNEKNNILLFRCENIKFEKSSNKKGYYFFSKKNKTIKPLSRDYKLAGDGSTLVKAASILPDGILTINNKGRVFIVLKD